MKTKNIISLTSLALVFAAGSAMAHFKLLSPASWIEEDDRGDPQKMAPCGGTLADGGTRTGAVTDVVGGQSLAIAGRIQLGARIKGMPESLYMRSCCVTMR